MKFFSLFFLVLTNFAFAAEPYAVATFFNMSLYWETSGDAETICQVEYRESVNGVWNAALDLWWGGNEYRGSVLNLKAGKAYDFRLTTVGGSCTITQKTWSEDFRIASIKRMTSSSMTSEVLKGGSAEKGYVVYDFSKETIDVKNQESNCLRVDADYVIIRNGSFINASNEAILIGANRRHVIIEGVTVEYWGSLAEGYNTGDRTGGIALQNGCSQIVIQGCHIRNPRFDAWDWTGGHGAPAGEDHPHGAFGIACPDDPSNISNNVFRFNHLEGNADRRLEDGMGSFDGNFSEQGFPGRDSDIYGNHIEYCVDNAIEAEGGGKNIRVYENYIDHVYTPLGTKAVSIGPAYFIRNIAYRSLPVKGRSMKFVKAGGDGMRYFFHNMTLSNDANCYNRGIDTEGAEILALNNVFVICANGIGSTPFSIGSKNSNNFDYNLANGPVNLLDGREEKHGIQSMPIFRKGNGPGKIGRFQLDKSSPGYDQGVPIDNVNDSFEGAAPDIGAHESGTAKMKFGPVALGSKN